MIQIPLSLLVKVSTEVQDLVSATYEFKTWNSDFWNFWKMLQSFTQLNLIKKRDFWFKELNGTWRSKKIREFFKNDMF